MNDPETAKTCSVTLPSATPAIAMAGPADSATGKLDPALASALAEIADRDDTIAGLQATIVGLAHKRDDDSHDDADGEALQASQDTTSTDCHGTCHDG